MSKTFRHTLQYLPAQLSAPLVQFFGIIIWTHVLDPAALGAVTLVVSLQEICFAVFVSWWSRYTLRFIGSFRAPGERSRYLRTEVFAVGLAILVQTVMVILLSGTFFPLSHGDLVMASLFMVTRSLNNYMSERARADAHILLYTLMQTAGPVIGFGVGLLLLGHYGSPVSAIFTGFVIAQSLGFLVSLAMCDFGRALGRPDPALLRTAIRFGGAVMAAAMLAIIAINLPRFIVSHVLGVAAVGMFAAGYGLGLRASSFAVTLVTAGSYPLVVRKMNEEGEAAAFAQLSTNIVLVALVVLPVALGLLAVNHSVVELLVAPQYRQVTYAVLPLATIGGLFRYLRAHTTDQVFLVKLRPGISTWIAVFDLIVAALSSYAGLLLWGLPGAALGPMASGFVTLTMSFVLSRLLFGFRAPVGKFLRLLAAAGVMAACVSALPRPHTPLTLLATIGLGAALYMAMVLLLLPAERARLQGMVRARLGRA